MVAAQCLHRGVVGVEEGLWACCGVGGVATGRWWQGGMTVAASVPCVARAAVVLLGHEGSGRCGLMGAVLPGQVGSGVRLKREVTINMLLGGACGQAGG